MAVVSRVPRHLSYAAFIFISISSLQAETLLKSYSGTEQNEYCGTVAALIGDINRDGFADTLLGSPEFGTHNHGKITIVSGYNGAVLREKEGDILGGHFGHAAASLGDLDGDRYPEFAVSAPLAHVSGTRGVVYILDGRTLATRYTFRGTSYDGRHGWSLANVGDYNNDGYPDLAVGDPMADTAAGANSGRVRIYSGYNGSIISDLTGERPSAAFGRAVSAAGDANGDGFLDVAVGAPFDTSNGYQSGTVSIFSGADNSLLAERRGSAGERLGYAIAPLGQFNGDASDDIAVGAPGYDNYRGKVLAINGANANIIASYAGVAPSDEFGFSLASGNFSGAASSRREILAGTHLGGYASMLKLTSGTLYEQRLTGAASANFGQSVSNASDLDRDGIDEVFITSPFSSSTAVNAGAADLYALEALPEPRISNHGSAGGVTPPQIQITPPDLRTSMTISGSGLGAGGVGVALVMAPPATEARYKWVVDGVTTGLDSRFVSFLGGRYSDLNGEVSFDVDLTSMPFAASNHSRFGYKVDYVLIRVPHRVNESWGVSQTKTVEVGYLPE